MVTAKYSNDVWLMYVFFNSDFRKVKDNQRKSASIYKVNYSYLA